LQKSKRNKPQIFRSGHWTVNSTYDWDARKT
jgi:hypothetical protein